MAMKEPRFAKCCCCINLKIGSCIYVGLSLLSSIIDIGRVLKGILSGSPTDDSDYNQLQTSSPLSDYSFQGSNYVELIITAIILITCVLFFKGVFSENPNYLLPFIIVQVTTIIIVSIIFLLAIIFTFGLALIPLAIPIIVLILIAYIVACVHSYYVSMKNESAPRGYGA